MTYKGWDMDFQSIYTAATAIGVGVGSFIGGRVTGRSAVTGIATETVELLQTQIGLLQDDKNSKAVEIRDLRSRVGVLEELVTQRAEVEQLSDRVSGVKETVDRIAVKVGA